MDEQRANEALVRRLRSHYERGEPALDTEAIARRAMVTTESMNADRRRGPRLALRLAGALLIVVLAVGVGLALSQIRQTGQGGPTPIPAPTGTAQPSITAAPSATPVPGETSAPSSAPSWNEQVIEPDAREAVVGDVAATPAGWVAVGHAMAQPAIWVTTDGETWSRVTGTPRISAGVIADVATTSDGLVAVGWASVGTGGSAEEGLVWTSEDGVNWSPAIAEASFAGSRLLAVTAGDGQLLALGNAADASLRAWISSDGGRSWQVGTPPAAPEGSSVSTVVWTGDQFVAVGEYLATSRSPGVWVSADAATWTRVTDGLGDGAIADLAIMVTGRLVAVGTSDADEAAVWLSTDGLEWSRSETPPNSPGLVTVASGAAGIVAATGQPALASVWRSGDGQTWERDAGFESPGGAVRGVAADDGGWLAVGDRDGVPLVWVAP